MPEGNAVSDDLSCANTVLANQSPEDIVQWLLARYSRPILSTSFGPQSAAMIHCVLSQRPDVPVVWVDHGFNTADTYQFVQSITRRYNADLRVYSPSFSTAWLISQFGGVPATTDSAHARFTNTVKLAPFEQALTELQPDLWLTGIRASETEHRRELKVLNQDRWMIKAAPFIRFDDADIQAWIDQHELPNGHSYFDPTKGANDRECGLHGSTRHRIA